ncbi:energy-coupling factor transporter transmembrane component T [Microbacteriaceae bacterium 4G12]
MRSAFSFVHPVVSFSYYVGVIMMSMVFIHPIFLATSALLLFWLNILQGNGPSMMKALRGILFFALVITIINPLITHRGATMLFYIFDNPVTLEAITFGYTMALSFITIAFAFASYNQIISSHKFLYLFSRISPKAALLTMITMRFVPLFIRRLTHITWAQKTKGVQLESGSLKHRAQSGMKLLTVLLVCSLEEALQTADSMHARGFSVTKRSTYIRYKMEKRDWILIGVFIILIAICMIGASNGAGILTIYPRLKPIGLYGFDWIAYASFILYISIPVLLEGREWIWWNIQR